MKNLFFAIILIVAFASCKKEPASMKLDPGTMFYIKGTSQTKSANTEHLSNLEIVKQAVGMQIHNYIVFGDSTKTGAGGWQEKDTVSSDPKFIMAGYQIIGQFGDLMHDYISSFDVVITSGENGRVKDTLAYIPNAQMRANEQLIKTAYANNDLNAVLQLFNNAWTFIPCTGAEYCALKKAGIN